MTRLLVGLGVMWLAIAPAVAAPETAYFESADGHTEIVGYLFKPDGAGPHPAVVMLHGRGGPYSILDNADCTLVARTTPSKCNAATLTRRHAMWGAYWAARGYLALLPDSFGPRGKARGFAKGTHDSADRDSVNERTVRPLDAEGALAYLRGRADVVKNRIYLQGWSNGGSTLLNVLIRQGTRDGFAAALAFYPGCGPASLLQPTILTSARITMFLAQNDDEVSPTLCFDAAERARAAGTRIDVTVYPGATHDFDDPGDKRQSVPANAAAKADAMTRAAEMVGAAGK